MDIPFSIPNPNSLPSPVDVFIDREHEVNLILDFLKQNRQNHSSGNVCVIHGLDGIGKTELCHVVADRLGQEYFDAQVYIKIDQTDIGDNLLYKVFEILIHIFDPLARLSDDLAVLHIQYLSELKGKKVLIVLDELQSDDNLTLLVPPPSSTLLITAKRPLEIPNALSLHLVGLSQENSEKLLKNICPRIGKYAADMSRVCRNNPLYLRLIASLLTVKTDLEVDNCIRELEGRCKQTDVDEQEDLFSELFVSFIFEKIHSTQRQFIIQLGIIPDGFKENLVIELAQAISDGNDKYETIKSYLDASVRMNFASYDNARKYYRMQSTIQNYALKISGNAFSAWYSFSKIYADLVEWFTSLASRDADGFLLSILVFDEHKSNIRKIIKYLQDHSYKQLDEIKLELFKLVNLFGQCRFLPIATMVPIMETEVDVALRLKNIDQLLSVLNDLSRTYLATGENKKALDYSQIRERLIQDRQKDLVSRTLEEIRVDRKVDLLAPDAPNAIESGLTSI